MDINDALKIVISFVICHLLVKIYRFYVYISYMKKLPSVGSKSIFGDLALFYAHRDNLTEAYKIYVPKFKQHGFLVVWLSFYPIVVVFSPQKLRMIFNNKKFLDHGWIASSFFLNLRGLLTLKNDEWKKRRKLILPPFSSTIINRLFMATFVRSSAIMVNELKVKLNEPINLRDIIGKSVLLTTLETSFGLKGRMSDLETIKWLKCAQDFFQYNTSRIYKPWLWSAIVSKLIHFITKKDDFREMVRLLIVSRLKQRKNNLHSDNNNFENTLIKKKAFLDHIIDVFIDNPSEFDTKNPLEALIDEVILLFVVSVDTTTSAVHSVLFELASNPDIQDNLYKQLETFDCESKDLTINDFRTIEYLDWCVKEGLRIKPSAPFTLRYISDDLIFDDFFVPRKSNTICSIYLAHHDPEVFPSPEQYIPERFSPENFSEKAKEAYMPFASGPRRCVGENLALAVIKVLVSNIVKNFKLELVPNQNYQIDIDISLRFKKYPAYLLSKREK